MRLKSRLSSLSSLLHMVEAYRLATSPGLTGYRNTSKRLSRVAFGGRTQTTDQYKSMAWIHNMLRILDKRGAWARMEQEPGASIGNGRNVVAALNSVLAALTAVDVQPDLPLEPLPRHLAAIPRRYDMETNGTDINQNLGLLARGPSRREETGARILFTPIGRHWDVVSRNAISYGSSLSATLCSAATQLADMVPTVP
jgi:hypothetical protein